MAARVRNNRMRLVHGCSTIGDGVKEGDNRDTGTRYVADDGDDGVESIYHRAMYYVIMREESGGSGWCCVYMGRRRRTQKQGVAPFLLVLV
jgi:hypothetical protein